MRVKVMILAAAAALSLSAADATPPKADVPAPSISTAKFWRLVAQAQQARQQANATPQAKAADAADLEVQKEQERLSGLCGASHILGYQQDAKAENAGDIICVKKPDPPASKEK
jgi:hypothetical protein